jgi:hypothetical protein
MKVLLPIIGWLTFLIAPLVFQINETADVAVQNIFNEHSMMFLLSGLVLIGIFYFNPAVFTFKHFELPLFKLGDRIYAISSNF